ncbi:MAG TPA: exodeoxyribonuclease V subunit gamma [Acidobacteriota bacterium]|nr:exodeoxyribonuclease V subunit gamma [Acidobacteriota bacterium]
MPLQIYNSNRMENLVGALAETVREPLGSPFDPEVIVVQSRGMQRWLAMELARQIGIWANCSYPFPNSVILQLFRSAFPGLPDDSSHSPELMTWIILNRLPRFLDRQEFSPLKRYLARDNNGLKRFQLCEKIADTFDQYTLFRPELLQKWESGDDADWQAILWRELAGSGEGRHRGQLRQDFLQLAASGELSGTHLPRRISVFGVSYLPKYHMDILSAVSNFTNVNFFLLSPCREYWVNTAKHSGELAAGNSLLASLGKLGKDFSELAVESGATPAIQEGLYQDPGIESLLASIQSDIFNLRGVREGNVRRPIAPEDLSVQIHSCHSPMREMEILHDNLLALLESRKGLAPREIVVMTPDIETYAPYITMVFEGCQDSSRKIPYSIADRSLTSEGQVAGAVLKLLGFPGSRLPVTSVIDVLEMKPVHTRFGLGQAELQTIRRWVRETRICWGADEKHRSSLGLPGYRENSFDAGLDRLLLGYAMPDEGGKLFSGILPFDELEGSAAKTLGGFADFSRKISAMAMSLAGPRTLAAWRDDIYRLLNDFIEADADSARDLNAVSGIVEHLGDLGVKAGFTGEVALSVIRSWLSKRLAQEEKGLGFMSGGVTFCAMLPMRSIPFRVVALVGMNDGAFPRQSRPPGFDLIARHPRRGDRSLREEDRYLFLECLLSARDCFYLSYVGQSIRDNSELPPSVLVSEFLDAVRNGFTAGDVRLEERLVTKHRLQAFSRDYFNRGSRLFSYSQENCASLLEADKGPWQPTSFIASALKIPSNEWRDIQLPRLIQFFDNPSRFILENRLRIRLEGVSEPLQEREAFKVDGLDAYGLRQGILEILLQKGDVRAFLPVARSRGILPPARHGEAAFSKAVEEVEDLAARIRERTTDSARLEPLDFDLSIGEFRLSGRLDDIWPERKLRYRSAKLKAKDQVHTWIEHLVLNACELVGLPRESLLLMSDRDVGFNRLDDARDILKTLLDFFWLGLTTPLRFFPSSSLEYAKGLEWNLDRARKKWEGDDYTKGEKDDPHFRLCFGQEDPFTAEFEQIAKAVLGPLVEHSQ